MSTYDCIKCNKFIVVLYVGLKTYSPNAVELKTNYCYGNQLTEQNLYCYICNECFSQIKNKQCVNSPHINL